MAECISREATLNLIEHNDKVLHYADERYENVVYATTQIICKVVAEMPATNVQPVKRGRWENEYLEDDIWWAECSNCKQETHSRYGRPSTYRYCPNCGARMDGDANG